MPEFDPPEPEMNSHGVKALGAIFGNSTFPITKQDLIKEYGDREVEFTSGETITVADIVTNSSKLVFYSIDELEQAFHERLSMD